MAINLIDHFLRIEMSPSHTQILDARHGEVFLTTFLHKDDNWQEMSIKECLLSSPV